MRTTLTLEQDVYEAARALAEAERRSLGEVVSRLARRGLAPARTVARRRHGFPVVSLPKGSRPVTSEAVRRLLDE